MQEICRSLGANTNEYRVDHWTGRDVHGQYEGSLVYWNWREQTVVVTTEGPEGLPALLAASEALTKTENLELETALQAQITADDPLSLEDLKLNAMGIPFVLKSELKALADAVFDAYDTDFRPVPTPAALVIQ